MHSFSKHKAFVPFFQENMPLIEEIGFFDKTELKASFTASFILSLIPLIESNICTEKVICGMLILPVI